MWRMLIEDAEISSPSTEEGGWIAAIGFGLQTEGNQFHYFG